MKFQLFSIIFGAFLIISCGEQPPNRDITKKKYNQTLGDGTNFTYQYINSGAHRDTNITDSTLLTYKKEIEARGVLPVPYRRVPKIMDSDLTDKSSENTRPTKKCGFDSTFNTLSARIKDCEKLNTAANESKKIGALFGNSGEGNWYLISKSDDGSSGHEVWLDSRTQLIWSSNLGEANSWCEAVGSNEESDQFDCLKENPNKKNLCADDSDSTMDSKGNLNSLVSWRIPTRSDFLIADVNGLRWAIDQGDKDFWTATGAGSDFESAWLYNTKAGVLKKAKRDTKQRVICVGVQK